VRPRLLALALAVLLVACGGGEDRKATAAGRFVLAPARPIIDVARVVQLIRSELQPTARAAAVVKDLEGTVVVRG
jgi:hypothetical protein